MLVAFPTEEAFWHMHYVCHTLIFGTATAHLDIDSAQTFRFTNSHSGSINLSSLTWNAIDIVTKRTEFNRHQEILEKMQQIMCTLLDMRT